VGRDERDHAEPVLRQALPDLDRHFGERVRAQAERARTRHVLVGIADPHSRREHRLQTVGDEAADRVGEQCVASERQVPALLLDRPEGHHDRRESAVDQPAQGRCS
jgi:hypothetical protein